jgi:hypothetical protein
MENLKKLQLPDRIKPSVVISGFTFISLILIFKQKTFLKKRMFCLDLFLNFFVLIKIFLIKT